MIDPREFPCMDDTPGDGYGNIDTDNGWNYVVPSEDWVNMEDEMEDTDVN